LLKVQRPDTETWERDQKKTIKDQKTKFRKHEKTQGNYHEIKAKPMDQKKNQERKEGKKETGEERKK
jgi:hypothetical protein